MAASYPGSVKTFTAKNAGDTIQAAHVTDLQDEVTAIEAGIRNGTAPLNSSNSTVVLLSVSGGQVVFPAIQNASAGANTLDDYEEGTWTPGLEGTGGGGGLTTYSTRVGFYIKIGKIIIATYDMTLTAKADPYVGNMQIGNLPFASDAGGVVGSVNTVAFASLGASWVNVVTLVLAGTSVALLQGNTAAAASNNTALQNADIGATCSLRGTIIYRASA